MFELMKYPWQGSGGNQALGGCHFHVHVNCLSFGWPELESGEGVRNAIYLTSYLPLPFVTQ